ncbi:PspC domain-containing protein [Streptomyces sp. TP-A0874]|uniref:PspC domain-containing protein n=1 Tax=Streptomyces sp. TP-A0874 TaxID=549819 RepID=UPI000853B827|nr:PspC domain-containing protein [Streptomyces sp. TP-A0874]
MTEQQSVPGATAPPTAAADDPEPALPPLRRSRHNKVLSGVCGGLGRQYDVDPVVFRVALTVLAIAGGTGLIGYGFAWLLIPLDGEDENEGRRLLSGRVEGQGLTALVFALVGCGLLLSMLNNGSVIAFALMLSAALAGAAYWSRERRHGERDGAAVNAATAQAVADAPPEATAPPVPGTPSWWRDPPTKGDGGPAGAGWAAGGGGYLWGPDDGPPPPSRPGDDWSAPEQSPLWPARRRGGWIGGWTFLCAVFTAVAAALLIGPGHPLGTTAQISLGCALAVFGLGLVLSSWIGRAGGGTVIAALVTCALLAGAAVLPKSITAEWVQRDWKPVQASTLRPEYQLGTGDGMLDLSGLRLTERQEVSTRASVGAGRLRVVVPADATVELSVSVGLGEARLPGENRPGEHRFVPGLHREEKLAPAGGRSSGGTVVLELEIGVGQLEVDRGTS